MTDQPSEATGRPVLTGVEPQLFVTDIRRSCEFYTTKLGFAVQFVHGEPPFYGQLARDAARLNLRAVEEPVFATEMRQHEQLLSASITLATTTELEELFRSYLAAGVTFEQPLATEPWGARTFVVADPDGNLILFAGPATD